MLLIDHCMGISALAGARLGVSRPGAGRRCLVAAAARAERGAGPSGRSCCRHHRPKAAERCRRCRARFASKARSGRVGGDQFTPRGYGGGVEPPRAAQGGGAHHRRVPAGFVYCVLAEKERALDQREQIHWRRRCCRRHNRRVVRRRRGGLGRGPQDPQRCPLHIFPRVLFVGCAACFASSAALCQTTWDAVHHTYTVWLQRM